MKISAETSTEKKTVIILGGGVAGLSAAHELVERGFRVKVYERKMIPGGKARSVKVPNTSMHGSDPLPGEHGFRFFPGFYFHLNDTMKRIPLGNGSTVFDNLIDTPEVEIFRHRKGIFKK
ncbi:MAG TPA: FAD-dependent oxidoreductase [Chitinophagales bacterium]|nr:FAD-dependent oxidoreductase [Chitinophagales bacterium]